MVPGLPMRESRAQSSESAARVATEVTGRVNHKDRLGSSTEERTKVRGA
jgi:hypothetical protein